MCVCVCVCVCIKRGEKKGVGKGRENGMENGNASRRSGIIKQMVTQEDKINLELKKKLMTEKKTKLPFLRNQNGKMSTWKLKK